MLLVGLVIGVAGVWSLRLVIVVCGFGAAWLLADGLEASLGASLIIGLAGAALALVLAIVAAKFLFVAFGLIVGAVVGAKLFVLLDHGDASIVLALVFVPAVAVSFAVLAAKARTRFIGWATAIAGAALVLSGLGLLAPDTLGLLHDPDDAAEQVVSGVLWVALAVAARLAQRRLIGKRES